MKSVKSFVLVALIAIVAVACGKVEKILVKKDGLWVGTSQTIVSYTNAAVTSTITETDSLGQTFFAKDGTGYSADFQGNNKSNFTWSVNDDNDILTITGVDSGAVAFPATILESSSKAMTLFSTISITVGTDVYKTEVTSEIARAE